MHSVALFATLHIVVSMTFIGHTTEAKCDIPINGIYCDEHYGYQTAKFKNTNGKSNDNCIELNGDRICGLSIGGDIVRIGDCIHFNGNKICSGKNPVNNGGYNTINYGYNAYGSSIDSSNGKSRENSNHPKKTTIMKKNQTEEKIADTIEAIKRLETAVVAHR
uniref:Uncharacterized protein n=1 Tax=Ditylenchus dipsaci TaxID=166011 RepID=A0A915E0E8_9BILA